MADWRDELDAVEARARGLERAAPGTWGLGGVRPHDRRREPRSDDGVHALVTLASARLGVAWPARHLIDVACAVELAYRATKHHHEITDRRSDGRVEPARAHGDRGDNRRHVLDGDWSITEAAVLVAEVGPSAYRLLVRGYGMVQLARLDAREAAGRTALVPTAVALGGLVGGVPADVVAGICASFSDADAPFPAGLPDAARICRWAGSLLRASSPLAVQR